MLYVNWVYKGDVIISQEVDIIRCGMTEHILEAYVQNAWSFNLPSLYSKYNKPENCERFFISTNNQLNKWVG